MTNKSNDNPYGLYQRNGKGNWYLPVRIDGQRKFVTTGTDNREEAEKRAPQIIARISAGIPSRPEGITVKQAFEQQIHERKLLDAPRNTLINWQQSMRVWCEQLGEDTLIADIMPRNINEFLGRNQMKKGTKRHHCIMLQTALKRAARMSNIEMRQDLFPRELMSRAAITIRRRFLSEEELNAVLDGKEMYLGAEELGERLDRVAQARDAEQQAQYGNDCCGECSEDCEEDYQEDEEGFGFPLNE
jgi:hypothetical protein